MSGLWGDWKLAPQTAEERKEVETVQGMRKRINEMSRHDPLVRSVMDASYYQGLSGEDTMTTLAYHALLRYERIRDLQLDVALTTVQKHIIIGTSTTGGEGFKVSP